MSLNLRFLNFSSLSNARFRLPIGSFRLHLVPIHNIRALSFALDSRLLSTVVHAVSNRDGFLASSIPLNKSSAHNTPLQSHEPFNDPYNALHVRLGYFFSRSILIVSLSLFFETSFALGNMIPQLYVSGSVITSSTPL